MQPTPTGKTFALSRDAELRTTTTILSSLAAPGSLALPVTNPAWTRVKYAHAACRVEMTSSDYKAPNPCLSSTLQSDRQKERPKLGSIVLIRFPIVHGHSTFTLLFLSPSDPTHTPLKYAISFLLLSIWKGKHLFSITGIGTVPQQLLIFLLAAYSRTIFVIVRQVLQKIRPVLIACPIEYRRKYGISSFLRFFRA